MRLLILGASGKCGQHLVRLAAERKHDVTAVVRATATYDVPSGVRVVVGDVLDRAFLSEAVGGCDAVASCLGIRRAGVSLHAKLLSPPDLMFRVMQILVPVMENARLRRLVVISAGGVGDSTTQLARPLRWIARQGSLGVAYRDLERMEDVLASSSLDWLAVRPVTLMNGPATGRAGPVEHYGFFSIVRRVDVAAWMLSALERTASFDDRTVLLGSRK